MVKQLDILSLLEACDAPDERRPTCRAECPAPDHEGVRACPWVGCRHHLAIDVRRRGKLARVYAHPFLIRAGVLQLDCGAPMCSLDLAELGGASLGVISYVMGGVSRERVNQIAHSGVRAMRDALDVDQHRRIVAENNCALHYDDHAPRWARRAQALAEEARCEGRRWEAIQ